MTRPKPTRLDRLALRTHCGHCGAKPGQWCIRQHGWAYRLHKARTHPAEYIYLAGVRDAARAAA